MLVVLHVDVFFWCVCGRGKRVLLLFHHLAPPPPDPFQNAVSSLGHRACEVLCVPFSSEVYISHRPLDFLKVRLQSEILWAFIFPVGPMGCAAWCGAQITQFLGRTSAIIIILLFVHHPPINTGLDYTMLLPFLLLLWFLTYIFSYRRSVLLVFWFFWSIVPLWIVVILVPVRGGEYRVFLVHYPSHFSLITEALFWNHKVFFPPGSC